MNFTESLALKVVSLLLALILWITILGFKREELRKAVKLEPMFPPGKVLLNRIPSQIQFTIVGPRVLLKDVEKKLQPIRPDLRNTRENTIALSMTEDLLDELPAGVKVTAIQPPNVVVRLEEVIERKIPVKPISLGATPEGWEVVSLRATPNEVAVTGPRSVVENLESVGTEPILLEDIDQSTSKEVTVEVDGSQGLQLSRQKVVTVKITMKRTRK